VGAFIDEWRVGSCSRRFSGLPDNITQTRVVYPRTGARSRRSRTWLYFCSAYTGRTYHRNPTYRRLAIAVYIALVAVKVTNPLHREYFTTTVVATPFPHLSVYTGPLHWTAMGLSYALAFVGYFMLLELFTQIDLDTRALFALVGITGLPVVLDLVGYTTPYLIDITYEPLGSPSSLLVSHSSTSTSSRPSNWPPNRTHQLSHLTWTITFGTRIVLR